ncbi:hypothetical protein VOLCADRAFT_94733 [Volvox carteri f. nagariensis]|uniref:Uncharacterized protein n=1 Tax=Volvox carteri f. nagariensis TaxID=3068 RepID=D8U5L3_VOLCA|nr:uncharacterized protein VOLCADRAFT_94733 [Volvox carteri f. nagariensis]EFJ44938.1 hypothetical protein VOLCADRAFT_94733 [Volvox carteri f. nagariensis]|eukprot:XP_002953909.1 hypothetical protein VOLCADRAFT_94733 [Volvox carteri f. nagariensis]
MKTLSSLFLLFLVVAPGLLLARTGTAAKLRGLGALRAETTALSDGNEAGADLDMKYAAEDSGQAADVGPDRRAAAEAATAALWPYPCIPLRRLAQLPADTALPLRPCPDYDFPDYNPPPRKKPPPPPPLKRPPPPPPVKRPPPPPPMKSPPPPPPRKRPPPPPPRIIRDPCDWLAKNVDAALLPIQCP